MLVRVDNRVFPNTTIAATGDETCGGGETYGT